MKRWFTVAIFSLVLAASTGALLRFGMVLGMPAWANNFGAIRHAHSHLMYFGWATLGFMALIWYYLPELTSRSLPKGVGAQMAASALLALLSFPAFWSNGYGLTQIGMAELPLGAMVAGLNGILWLIFAFLYFRATWALSQRPLPIQIWDWAIFLLLISFGGALGLVGFVVMDGESVALQQIFLHLFLDIFAVGWFNLALLGVLWAWLGKYAQLPRWLPSQSLALCITPTFLLGVSPILLADALFWVAATANLGAAALLAWHLGALWRQRVHLPPPVQFGLIIFAVHIISAIFIMWPGFWRWSASTQLRIFFLHNFLLGWISSALLGIVAALCIGWTHRMQSIVSVIWSSSVSVMLLALLWVGFIQLIPMNAVTLFWIAAWSSVTLALVSLWVGSNLLIRAGSVYHVEKDGSQPGSLL
ncbi:MAG: hypothetical protein H6641_19895 [Caldilineaceae bacterium]|nr:hypothetical protein [Caldilineaceae bacterium]MCB9151026.1 hypothetical protein [Caldilineaceae bacterium]